MRIKLIASAAAIALAATISSASAAEQFTTLDGVSAATMSAGEMAVVRGQAMHDLHVHRPAGAGGSPGAAVLSDNGLSNDAFLFNPGLAVATTKNARIHWAPHP